jgi:hypothetical protein
LILGECGRREQQGEKKELFHGSSAASLCFAPVGSGPASGESIRQEKRFIAEGNGRSRRWLPFGDALPTRSG